MTEPVPCDHELDLKSNAWRPDSCETQNLCVQSGVLIYNPIYIPISQIRPEPRKSSVLTPIWIELMNEYECYTRVPVLFNFSYYLKWSYIICDKCGGMLTLNMFSDVLLGLTVFRRFYIVSINKTEYRRAVITHISRWLVTFLELLL